MLISDQRDKLEFVGQLRHAGGKWDAARAPLCKGSCREATEGLCSTTCRLKQWLGEKVRRNDFAVEFSRFDDASAKWGAEQTLYVRTMGTPGSLLLQPLSQLR